ncbi:putative oxidoreductase [Truncatella angustata]|uniref:Oxidoreductase n=1 Tax=Truncatella angustata TaxID=152316 RepID=A0A9P9A2D8_9PEZI|nr:putative oxidoreductase [Truncatella angustata]KAH6659028.1 putative oxidoreductase [Truncatella angustata]KAH8200685.1 hypothetical protein TruAng_005149 [Truncatella angustata]
MAPFPSPTKIWHTTVHQSISSSRPELSAKGKTVVVTGGGTGIGAETALHFAQAGASRIALFGRREQPLLDTKASIESKYPNVEVFTSPCDVTKKADVDAAFAKFASGGQKIHVVVSNAAVTGPMGPVSDVDPSGFIDGVQINLLGALLVAQAFLRYAAPDAVAVNVSSSAAHVNFGPGFASYSVAKMAVVRLWDSLANAHPKMSVFHIQPGVVDTAMNREAGGVAAMGFADDASLPAGFILWLASPEARFLKGKFLWANWDVDELKSRAKELEASSDLSIGLVGWPFGEGSFKVQVNTDDPQWAAAPTE